MGTGFGFVRGNDDKLNPAMFRRVAELMDEELSKAQEAGKVALSPNTDQDAALRDLNQCWVSDEDRKRAERMRKRIEKKAIEYGVWEEGPQS
jgi:hypothetical protein